MSEHPADIASGLVQRARRGDDKALRDLIECAYPLVRRWSLVRTGDPSDADDLTQDVLVQMIRKLEGFKGDAQFGTWLYSITRNAAADRYRKDERRARLAESPGAYDALVPAAVEDPARLAERTEVRAALEVFFEELPERQREIFDLVELQGLPSTDVAELLGIEPVSVRAHLFKARRRLRERILAERPDFVEGLR